MTEMTKINLSLHTLGRHLQSCGLGTENACPTATASSRGCGRTLGATRAPSWWPLFLLTGLIARDYHTLKFADNAKRVMVQAVADPP